jgi:hypothetical protein
MPPKEFHYRWEYELEAGPEELWPLVADTNRFNADAGVPAVEALGLAGNARRLRLFKFGIAVEWEEQPFEWVRPFRFGVLRQYKKGPVSSMRVEAELHERPQDEGGGTKLIYQVWAEPRNLLGRLAIPIQIGVQARRSFGEIFRRYDREIKAGRPPLYRPSPATFAQGGRARLKALSERLIAQGASPDIVGKLAEMIEQADDLTLARLRSHALADYWNLQRREVLEVCLWATRVGLLDLQWEMICPHCRGSAETSSSLAGIKREVYCETCDVDFSINFDRAVELTFRPNPSVRVVEGLQFCVGGPQVTPHVVVQQLLTPGAKREVRIPLESGRYRLRSSELAGGRYLRASAEGAREATLQATDEGWPDEELCLGTMPKLLLENATDRQQYFVLERMAWSDQAATAAEVTALQVFRDLFANEALRPGE